MTRSYSRDTRTVAPIGAQNADSSRQPVELGITRAAGYKIPLSVTVQALPSEVVADLAWRLGIAGALYSLLFASLWIISAFTRPEGQAGNVWLWSIFGTAIALGLVVLIFSRRANAARVSHFGLVFEVLGALLIGLAETSLPYGPGEMIRGQSGIAIWVLLFVLLVPIPSKLAVLASFSSALMGVAGMGVNHILQAVPAPDAGQLLRLAAGPVLIAGVSMPLTRWIYDLGRQVQQERDAGSYQLLERIGAGGMGEVWRASHRMLARPAAVKLILPQSDIRQIERMEARLELEARATALLRSPHTVTLYDYGVTASGNLYYAMELIDGANLFDLVNLHGPMPPPRAAHVLRQLCLSLEEAHSLGVVHRDIKPQNILLGRQGVEHDFAKVVDFGLATLREESSDPRFTQQGFVAGTPAFMAPEAAYNISDVDSRSDLYSLGCVGYWLLTGHTVFTAESGTGMLLKQLHEIPIPPSERIESPIPEDFEAVLLACLEKTPDDRPESAAEIRRVLDALLRQDPWTEDQAANWWSLRQGRTCQGRR